MKNLYKEALFENACDCLTYGYSYKFFKEKNKELIEGGDFSEEGVRAIWLQAIDYLTKDSVNDSTNSVSDSISLQERIDSINIEEGGFVKVFDLINPKYFENDDVKFTITDAEIVYEQDIFGSDNKKTPYLVLALNAQGKNGLKIDVNRLRHTYSTTLLKSTIKNGFGWEIPGNDFKNLDLDKVLASFEKDILNEVDSTIERNIKTARKEKALAKHNSEPYATEYANTREYEEEMDYNEDLLEGNVGRKYQIRIYRSDLENPYEFSAFDFDETGLYEYTDYMTLAEAKEKAKSYDVGSICYVTHGYSGYEKVIPVYQINNGKLTALLSKEEIKGYKNITGKRDSVKKYNIGDSVKTKKGFEGKIVNIVDKTITIRNDHGIEKTIKLKDNHNTIDIENLDLDLDDLFYIELEYDDLGAEVEEEVPVKRDRWRSYNDPDLDTETHHGIINECDYEIKVLAEDVIEYLGENINNMTQDDIDNLADDNNFYEFLKNKYRNDVIKYVQNNTWKYEYSIEWDSDYDGDDF